VFAQTVAITNGKVYPVNSGPITNGTVLIKDGSSLTSAITSMFRRALKGSMLAEKS